MFAAPRVGVRLVLAFALLATACHAISGVQNGVAFMEFIHGNEYEVVQADDTEIELYHNLWAILTSPNLLGQLLDPAKKQCLTDVLRDWAARAGTPNDREERERWVEAAAAVIHSWCDIGKPPNPVTATDLANVLKVGVRNTAGAPSAAALCIRLMGDCGRFNSLKRASESVCRHAGQNCMADSRQSVAMPARVQCAALSLRATLWWLNLLRST